MKLAIMQPYFFPYIGYFQLMAAADLWIAFDQTQFIDKGWINRNRILHPEPAKEWQYITLPLSKRGQFDKICDITINSAVDWRAQILGKLTLYKNVAPYYDQTIEFIRYCFASDETNLAKYVIEVLRKTASHIGIPTSIKVQSELGLRLGEVKHPGQWALRISETLGADEYINPIGGKEILKHEEFFSSGIKLSFQQTDLAQYSQGREGFISGLSVIDLLMFNGINGTAELIYTCKSNDIEKFSR